MIHLTMGPLDMQTDEIEYHFRNIPGMESNIAATLGMMSEHPSYMMAFMRAHTLLMEGSGPLPLPHRYYIAMMATARHQCSYLMESCKAGFLACGGNPEWLAGLSSAPSKLYKLSTISKILAHQPWCLQPAHLNELRTSDKWSLTELMQALTILAHFHALSSLVFGCGAEVQKPTRSRSSSTNGETELLPPPSPPTGADGQVEYLMETMKCLGTQDEHLTEEEVRQRFDSIRSQFGELPVAYQPLPVGQGACKPFVEDPDYQYSDFAKREQHSAHTLRFQDFAWEDQGYAIFSELYDDAAQIFDDKFKLASNLTYFTLAGNKSVDTSPFRRSVWNYIHSIYGLMHDDYDYGQVNQLLERPLKGFMKTVACFPERNSPRAIHKLMSGFQLSEKIHVVLMIMEARLQAELLYCLRAMDRILTYPYDPI